MKKLRNSLALLGVRFPWRALAILLLTMGAVVGAVTVSFGQQDPYHLNLTAVNCAFEKAHEAVLFNPTGSRLNSFWQVGFDLRTPEPDTEPGPPMGIPAVAWGLVFGFPGMVCVYMLSGEDARQTRLAFWGCTGNTLLLVGLNILILVI